MDRKAGLVAAGCALALTGLGPVALMVVPSKTVVAGDAAATAALQVAEASLVRVGAAAELGIVAVELVMTVALYALFEARQRHGARLVAVSRLAMTALQAVTALAGIGALSAFVGGDAAIGGGLLGLKAAGTLGWQALFGVHCAVLAGVMARERAVPRLLAGLMGLTAAGYLAVGFGGVLAPEHAALFTSAPVTLAMMGEVAFYVWLLVAGLRRPAPAYTSLSAPA